MRRTYMETMTPEAFDEALEKRYQIYLRPYISQREAAYLLGISPQTFAKQVREMNAKKETIRILKRIGIPIDDMIKAFRLEADRDRVISQRQQKSRSA